MRYYSEEPMKFLRTELEGQLLCWPGVTAKTMFGCPCYLAHGVLFAFLVTGGVVMTRLPTADADELIRRRGARPFEAGKRTVRAWHGVPVRSGDLDAVLPFVRRNYEATLHPRTHAGSRRAPAASPCTRKATQPLPGIS